YLTRRTDNQPRCATTEGSGSDGRVRGATAARNRDGLRQGRSRPHLIGKIQRRRIHSHRGRRSDRQVDREADGTRVGNRGDSSAVAPCRKSCGVYADKYATRANRWQKPVLSRGGGRRYALNRYRGAIEGNVDILRGSCSAGLNVEVHRTRRGDQILCQRCVKITQEAKSRYSKKSSYAFECKQGRSPHN